MKFRSLSRISLPLASALAALLTSHSLHAASLYWDTNGNATGSGAATGNWDGSTALWSTNSAGTIVPDVTLTTDADDLFFSAGTIGTGGTVTVSSTQAARSITFEEGAIVLNGGTINLGSASGISGMFFPNVSGHNVNSAIILNSAASNVLLTNRGNQTVAFGSGGISGSSSGLQTITIGGSGSAGGQFTFGGIISNGGGGGTVGLTVSGASTYTLSAANAYTGATTINSGTLQVNNVSTFANTSAILLGSTARLNVNAANSSLAELATAGGGSGVVAGSFLRYSTAQTAAGSGNGPGTIFGTVELNVTNANPNYTLDFASGAALTNLITATYTSPLTLSGTASIDASPANVAHTATFTTGGITASTAGSKTLNLTGTNITANTISSDISNGSGNIGVIKGGGGRWILSGTNTYTGKTLVDSGTLQFTNQVSLYNDGVAAAWTKDNIIVGAGATLAFNVGTVGQFTKENIIALLGMSDSASNGFSSGSSLGLDTSSGIFVYDSIIANTNSGANVIGLTKLGTNTLILDQDNTYTGRTVITAGILQLGDGGTTGKLSPSSVILNNGNLTIFRNDAVVQGTDFSSAPITGTGSFTQAGSGTTTLNAANTFSGTTTVSDGVLNLTNPLALQNSALVTTGVGTVTFTGFTTPAFGGLSGSVDLETIIPAFSGTASLTLNPLSGSVTYGGVITDGVAGMTLTKNGAGTQILSGANTYSGATIVNGGTLTVGSGANGSISSSSALQMGGGIFNYSRTGAGQTVNGLTINAGNSTVNNTSSGQTLTLGAITRTGSIYGTVNFATLTGAINTSTTNTNGIIGTWATTGSTTTLRYAAGAGNISGLTGTTATANTLANVTDAAVNYEYSAAVALMPASTALTGNTLRYGGAATTTAINATSTLTLNGLMQAGTGLLTISGGPSTGGIIIGASKELIVSANAQNTTISSVIANGASAGTLVYSGAGSTLTLSGANTYSGGLVINSGIVATGAAASGSAGGTGTGPITANAAGRLTLNSGVGTLNRALILNGGSLFFAGSGNDLTFAGTIVLGANSTIDATNNNSGFPTITADISGTGGFTKTNLGGVRLNGANTYSGPTVVSAGGVTVKSSLYGNDTAKWTPANITVASGATLALNVSATEFTISQAATMFTNLATNVNNNGLQAGSFIGVDTRNATAGSTFTYSANITDSTGAGGGAVSFKHTGGNNGAGVGTTTLELTGANTYSGMTIVDNDGFLKVSALNSVFTNAALGTVHSASSSLGAPTTVANGTIHLGTAGSTAQSAIGNTFRGGSLIYTGTGETTDRIISLNGGGGETYVLDQSGTGHLKFLSSFASIDTRSVKTITLRGSTAGTGEIAGTIPNAGNGNNNLIKSGTGTWTLSGTNLYGGTTTISASGGTLQFAKQVSLYNNNEASWVKTNIIINTGSTLALNVGGTGEFTTGNVTTLLTNLNTSINNNGLRSGSRIGFDTTNAAGGTFTIADTIANSTGTGSGAVGLTKLGTNTLILTGPNTYTGATTISAGTLLINGTQTTATGAVAVNGGTLGGNGTTGGTVTVAAAGNIAPGTSAGTLSIGGDLNITALADGGTGKLRFELGPVATSDKIEVTGTLTMGDEFLEFNDFVFTGISGLTNGTYKLITSSAISGSLSLVPANLTGAVGAGIGTLQITDNDLELVVSGIASGSAYDTWATLKGLTGLPSSSTDPAKNADPDGDGKNNLYEFAFDGNPLSGVNDGKIVGKVATVDGADVLTLTLPVRGAAPAPTFSIDTGDRVSVVVDDIIYRIEGDEALSPFADTITEVTGDDATAIQAGMPTLSSGWSYRTFRAPGTTTTIPKAFLRAKVITSP